MESFFLAETTKYLYLLFDPDNFIHNNGSSGTVIQTPNGECVIDAGGYFFNTEAHPIDSAAVYCCSAEKKADDAELQSMHDNLDLLTLLEILDSTEDIIGEKLILKTSKDKTDAKEKEPKGETSTVLGNSETEKNKDVEKDKNNGNSLSHEQSTYIKTESEKLSESKDKRNAESTNKRTEIENTEKDIQDKSSTVPNRKSEHLNEMKKRGKSDKNHDLIVTEQSKEHIQQTESIKTQQTVDEQSDNINSSIQSVKNSSQNNESQLNITESSNSKVLSVLKVTEKQETLPALPSTNTLVQLLSLLSGKQLSKGDNKEWHPDVNHLYQIIQYYPSVYKSKPELMMCKAQSFHMRWSVNGEMFESEND